MDSFSDSTDCEAKLIGQISLESIAMSDILDNNSEMDRFPQQKTGPLFEKYALELFIAAFESCDVDIAYRLGWKLNYYPDENYYRAKVDEFLRLADLQDTFEPRSNAVDLESDGLFLIRHPVMSQIKGKVDKIHWKVKLPALVLIEVAESSSEQSLINKLWQLMRNLAILRKFEIRSIQMDKGSLLLWTDDEIQNAIKSTHLFVVSDGGVVGNVPISVMEVESLFSCHLMDDRYRQLLGIANLKFIYLEMNLKRRQQISQATQTNQPANDEVSQLPVQNEANTSSNDASLAQPTRIPDPRSRNIFDVFPNQNDDDNSQSRSSDDQSEDDSERISQGDEFEDSRENSGELTGRKKIKKD